MKTLKNSKRWVALLALVMTTAIVVLAWSSAPAPEAEGSEPPLGVVRVASGQEQETGDTPLPQSPLAQPELQNDGPSLCPGEDIDRQGYNETDGNDFWGYKYPPAVVTPTHVYTCTGWIHWAPQTGEGGSPDVDYVHFRTTEADLGRTMVARLSMPKDYSLSYIAPLNADRGFLTEQGTQDKVLEFSIGYAGVYAVKVVSRSYPPDFAPPEFDPDELYLLTLQWKDGR